MELIQLRLFVSLSRTLNFTKTAQEFFMTQPAVSYHMKELENELNVQLFIRDTHKTSFTQAGIEMLAFAKDICDLEENAKQRMKNISEGRVGRLTIALLQDYVPEVTEILLPYSQKFPHLQIDTCIMEGSELIASIQNDEYDFYFAISSMISCNPKYQSVVNGKHRMEIYLYNQIAEKINIENWSTLSPLPFLSITQNNRPLYERTIKILHNHHYQPEVIYYYNRVDSILASVNSGIGFAILPVGFHNSNIYSHIQTIPLSDSEAMITSSIGIKRWNYTEAARQFAKMILDKYHRNS